MSAEHVLYSNIYVWKLLTMQEQLLRYGLMRRNLATTVLYPRQQADVLKYHRRCEVRCAVASRIREDIDHWPTGRVFAVVWRIIITIMLSIDR